MYEMVNVIIESYAASKKNFTAWIYVANQINRKENFKLFLKADG